MSTSTKHDPIPGSGVESRVLREGYGSGAWHGPDLKAAIAEVTPALARTLSWPDIRTAVDTEQQRLRELIEGVEAGTVASPIADEVRPGLVLGITCHAIYHAGQVQLIGRLHGG